MIIITGATSGIGEACARAFAAEGRQMVLLGRRKYRLDSLAEELNRAGSGGAVAFELDVRDQDAVRELAEQEGELFSKATVLVNNAGLARGVDPIQSGETADWEAMIDTNIKGLLYVTRAVLPFLIKNAPAHVVNIGSVAGRWVYPGGNVYCATKHAVRALNEAMRLDLAGKNVRVTEIAPGMVETEFSQIRFDGDVANAKAVYAGMEPLKPEDIAEAVLWCVNRPKHVNVQELVIYPTDQASPTLVHRRR